MTDRQTEARRLRAALEARDLSIAWAARRIGVSREYVSRALRPPYRGLTPRMVEALEQVLTAVAPMG